MAKDSQSDEVVLETDPYKPEEGEGKQKTSQDKHKDVGKSKVPFSNKIDFMMYIIIIGFVLVLALGFLSYAEYGLIQDKYQKDEKQRTHSELNKVSHSITVKLEEIQEKFKSIATTQFQNNLSDLAGKIYSNATLEIVPLPFDSLAITDEPSQGYAFLSMLAKISSQDNHSEISHFDMIKPGSEHESIVVMRYLKAESSEQTSDQGGGFIAILRLPKSFIDEIFSGIKVENGFIQVYQGQNNQFSLYKQQEGTLPLNLKSEIKQSTWSLSYFYSVKDLAFSFNAFLLVILYGSIALSLFLFTAVISVRRLKKYMSSRRLRLMQEAATGQNSVLASDDRLTNLGQQTSTALTDVTQNDSQMNQEIEDPLNEAIFTQHGIRGLVKQQITTKTMQFLGQYIAEELDNLGYDKITVARDNRESSQVLSEALIKGLKTHLINIYDIGETISPIAYYHAHENTQSNAVMVTAGSMTANYNGLKVLINGEYYSQIQLKSLCQDNSAELSTDALGKVINAKEKVSGNYLSHLRKQFQIKMKSKIVLDTCHSTSGSAIKRLLSDLGCDVIHVRSEPNASFDDNQPNPSKPDNLQLLIEKVKSEKASIGFFLNSDATALGIISAQGKIIWPDRVMMLLSKNLLSRHQGAKIFYDVKSTSILHDWILEYKGEPDLCPSGYINLQERMRMQNADLAGEFTGHYFLKENDKTHDDAIYVLLKVLQIATNESKNITELFESLPDKVSTPEILIAVQPGQLEDIVNKLIVQKDELSTMGVITLDGIRVEYEDGWGLIRASHTANALSLRFEANDHAALQRIAEQFKAFVLSIVFVKFPF